LGNRLRRDNTYMMPRAPASASENGAPSGTLLRYLLSSLHIWGESRGKGALVGIAVFHPGIPEDLNQGKRAFFPAGPCSGKGKASAKRTVGGSRKQAELLFRSVNG